MLTDSELEDFRRSAQRVRRPKGPSFIITCRDGPLVGIKLRASVGMQESGSIWHCTVTKGGCVCASYDRTGKFKGWERPGAAASGMKATA